MTPHSLARSRRTIWSVASSLILQVAHSCCIARTGQSWCALGSGGHAVRRVAISKLHLSNLTLSKRSTTLSSSFSQHRRQITALDAGDQHTHACTQDAVIQMLRTISMVLGEPISIASSTAPTALWASLFAAIALVVITPGLKPSRCFLCSETYVHFK